MKVLVVAPAWVGDMVMAHSLIQLLARQRPTRIDVLAPPATEPLARRMAEVTATVRLDVGHGQLAVRRRRAVARALRDEGYEQAIVLPNSFKSALIPYWAKIPTRTGWIGESRLVVLNDRRKLDPANLPLMIERFMALGLPADRQPEKPYPLPRLVADSARAELLRQRHGLDASAVTVLCPGAEFGPAKRWPAEHYAALAAHQQRQGRQVWLLGSSGDVATCDQIRSLAPAGVISLAGQTSLLDAVDLLSCADRVICNDSGLMHVAAALDREVIAIFGSTSADFTPPLGPRSRVVSLGLDCSPCFQRQCPLGHLKCLRELGPERVTAML